MKRALKLCLGCTIVLVMIFALSIFIIRKQLQVPEVQAWLADQICNSLPEPWNKNVTLGRIGGKLPGQFLISSLRMDTSNGDTLVLENLELSWDWWALFKGRFVLQKLQVSSVHTSLQQSKEGIWLQDFVDTKMPPKSGAKEKSQRSFELPKLEFALKKISFKSIKLELNSHKESWSSLIYDLEELHIEALGDINTDHIGLDTQLYSSMRLALDKHPPIELSFYVELKSQENKWYCQLRNGDIKSLKSRLSFNVELESPNDLASMLQNPMKHLNTFILRAQCRDLKLDKDEINSYREGLFKEDLLGEFQVEIEGGKPRVQIDLRTSQSKVWILGHGSKVWPIDDNLIELSGGATVVLNDWMETLDGRVDFKFDAKSKKISELDQLWLKVELDAINPRWNQKELAPLDIDLMMTNGNLELGIHSYNNVLQFDAKAEANKLVQMESWSDVLEVPLTLETKLEVKDLEEVSNRYAKVLSLPHLKGQCSMHLKGAGDARHINLNLSTKTKNLVIERPLPEEMNLDFGFHLSIDRILNIDQNKLSFSKKKLMDQLKKLSQVWPDLMALGNIEFLKFHAQGNHMPNHITECQLNISQDMREDEYAIRLETQNHQGFADQLNLGISLHKEGLGVQFKKFDFAFLNDSKDLETFLPAKLSLARTSTWTWDWQKLELEIKDFKLKHSWLKISGRLGFMKPLDLKVSLESPDLKQLPKKWFKDSPILFDGKVAALLKVEGNWEQPKLSLALDARRLKALSENFSPITFDEIFLNADADLSKEGSIKVETRIVPTGEVGLGIELFCPLEFSIEEGQYDIGDIILYKLYTLDDRGMDLDWTRPLVSSIIQNIQGNLAIDLNGKVDLNHLLKELELGGRLQVRNVKGKLLNPPLEIDSFKFDMMFEPTSLRLNQMSLTSKDSYIKMYGQTNVENYNQWNNPSWDMFVQVHQWNLKLPPELEADIDAELKTMGNLHSHKTNGNVSVSNMLLKPKLELEGFENIKGRDPNITMVDSLQSWDEFDKDEKKVGEEIPAILKNAMLDLSLKLLHNNRVMYKNMLKSEIQGELIIKKEHSQKEVHPYGEVNLLRSRLTFQGKKFRMEKGRASWKGEWMPNINMNFLTEIKPYEIVITLQGPVDRLRPKLSSRPWLENADIMSVLVFGKLIHSSASQESEVNAMDIAVSQGSQILGQKLGFDRYGVSIDQVNRRGGKISIGRYLHPKIYLSASKTVGDEDGRELSLEYVLMRYLKLKLAKELDSPIGIDFEWGKDY